MNQEKINAAAVAYSKSPEYETSQSVFQDGVYYAAANPDVIGCVKMEDVKQVYEALEDLVQLKEWKEKNGADEHYRSKKEGVWYKAMVIMKSYSYLFQQQKQQG